jgi:cysteinyl-tRNA synthetase
MIAERITARTQKNWAESDRLRDALLDMGVVLMDSKAADGSLTTTWNVKR